MMRTLPLFEISPFRKSDSMTSVETLLATTSQQQTFSWGFDLCWPRESASELSDAFAGMRLNGGLAVAEGGLVVFADTDWDALSAALRGLHPLDRLRALLNDTGSKAWLAKALQVDVPTRALEELANVWPGLGAAVETAMLEAARDPEARETTAAWRLLSERAQNALVALEDHFRLENAGLERLPIVQNIAEAAPEALARRRLLHRADGPVYLDLRLPFFSHKTWPGRFTELAAARVETGADGSLWICRAEDKHAAHQNHFHAVAACAGAWLCGRPDRRPAGFSITFDDTRVMLPEQTTAEWFTVLSGYGLAEGAREMLTHFSDSHPVQASLHLRLAGDAMVRWTEFPAQREAEYFSAFQPVARAVQLTLRRWLPLAWFWSHDLFEEQFVVDPRLAYQATPIFTGQPRNRFTLDPLDDKLRQRALSGVRKNLPALVAALRARLEREGQPKLAKRYDRRATIRILNLIARFRHNYDGLLIAETRTNDHFMLLAEAGRTLRQSVVADPVRAARSLAGFSHEFASAAARRFRRILPIGELPLLPSLLIIEATRAIAPEYPVEASLVLRQSGRELVLRKG